MFNKDRNTVNTRRQQGIAAVLFVFCLLVAHSGIAQPMSIAVTYFEIPVTDLERAQAFYEHVFGVELERGEVDGYPMAFFPEVATGAGISGALAKGDVYKPAKRGPVLYFATHNIDEILERVLALQGKVLYAKKQIGEAEFVAEFEDSEGNRIALHQNADSAGAE